MKGERIEFIYELGKISALEAWEVIFEYLTKTGAKSSIPVQLSLTKTTLGQVHEYIDKFKYQHFGVEFNDCFINFGDVANGQHTLIYFEDKSNTVTRDWEQLVKCFADRVPFIQAWLSNIEYKFWQNAYDPIQYTANGRTYEGLPMKSNGLPYPLEQMIIDVSRNPCRRIIRDGYVEAIGATMWLGEEFWSRTGADKDKVMQVYANEIKQLENNILKLQVADELFTESSDKSVQEKLRELIYG